MVSCDVNFTIRLPNNNPASFATVDVWERRSFLWWEYDSRYVVGRTANFYGQVIIPLEQGKKYHFVFKHPLAKRADLIRVLDYCPYYAGVWFPY